MNDNIKLLVTTMGGAAIGSLITFVIVKEKYETIMDDEIEAMRVFYEKRKVKQKDTPRKDVKKVVVHDDLREATSIGKSYGLEEDEYEQYTKAFKGEESNERPDKEVEKRPEYKHIDVVYPEDEMTEDDLPNIETIPEDEYREEPYLISFDEFVGTMLHVDKVDLVYFKGDQMLVDDQDQMVEDIDNVIGDGALLTFGNDPDEPNVIHVRNDRLGADYEIVQNDSSYGQHVLGEDY